MEGAQIPGDSVKGNKGRPLHVEGGWGSIWCGQYMEHHWAGTGYHSGPSSLGE